MPAAVVKSYAKKLKVSPAKIEKLWDQAKSVVDQEYRDTPSKERYKIIVSMFRKLIAKKYKKVKEIRIENGKLFLEYSE